MDAVSASATAMDAVSVSDIALDAIWASSTAWDIVKAKSMAVGKFAVGRAGLDGANYTDIDDVVSSQPAMDAVSTSTVAMDAVAASALAMDAVIAATDVALPTVVESPTAMDAVSTSQTAMDAVSTSQTAMDAVSTSDLALDSIWNSATAWDTVKTKAMAVGKFVAGRAGLDGANYADIGAVTSDQTAMDAVAASTTAMDSIVASTLALGSFLGSSVIIDTIWTDDTDSKTVWSRGIGESLPTTVLDDDGNGTPEYDLRFIPGPRASGQAIEYEWVNRSGGNGTTHFFEYTVDITDYTDLVLQTEKANNQYNPLVVQIDNTEIFSTTSTHNWTERTLDVSTYDGNVTIKIGIKNTTSGQATEYLRHAEPRLV